MTVLTNANLPHIGAFVPVPAYDRTKLTCGIVHFGVGGFHRAHQAPTIDALMRTDGAEDWAIAGVGLKPQDKRMRDILTSQDGLYTLVVKHYDGRMEPRVIGSIIDYMYAPEDPEAVLARLADPAVRLVSLTITEAGYNIDHATGDFVEYTADVVEDLAPNAVPRTVFGLVVESLRRRRDAGMDPFSVMTCDNMPRNGEVARLAFVSFARLRDPGLAEWIDHEVAFPNSVVDRITPITNDSDREEVRDQFDVEDGWPVVTEPYLQWILEDRFHKGVRPPYELAGVRMVDDVAPYEAIKLRLFNAAHLGLGYFGLLAGHTYVHEAAQDPALRRFVERYLDEEAAPTVASAPGMDVDDYKRTVLDRFTNPALRDTVSRLCMYGSARFPAYLFPVIRNQLAIDGSLAMSAAMVAGWARLAEGHDERGEEFELVDDNAAERSAAASLLQADPLAFIRNPHIFGSLAQEPRFTEPYLAALESLHAHGARSTLEALVRDDLRGLG